MWINTTFCLQQAVKNIGRVFMDPEDSALALVNGSSHTSGQSATWDDGENTVIVVVTNGNATKTYRVTVTKDTE